jgi:membrane associated rhomboid family serine protease
MSSAAGQERVRVFAGSRRACGECALVLEAQDIAYELTELDGEWALFVESAALDAAREEISRYAAERRAPRREPKPIEVFAGARWGAVVFAVVLLAAAYCAGAQTFGIDWFAAGALDARAGGAGEWWRAITALTLHLDQTHLLGNLLFGAGIGVLAGRVFGPGIAWASILGAGALANYLDMLIAPATHRAVGASTAVFGALGLLAGYCWRQRLPLTERFRYRWAPLFAGICLLGLLGAGDEHVDVLGHALGFSVGTGLGFAYARAGVARYRSRSLQLAAATGAIALIVLAWVCALVA